VAITKAVDMRARLAVTITPADIGRRVTIRARYHGPDAGAIDVVGVLDAWHDGRLTITRHDGQRRVVAQGDLLAAKVIPNAPDRRARSRRRHSA
jgi:hypothetical protein